jgi:hypothetical protein
MHAGWERTEGLQAPDIDDQVRFIALRSSLVSPGNQSARGICAELIGIRSDADSSQVEPIGIPAGLKSDIAVGEAVGVQPAGFEKKLEVSIVEMDQLASQRPGIFGPSVAVTEIAVLVHAPRVMKQGKKSDDLDVCSGRRCESLAIFQHAGPVDDAVIAPYWQGIGIQNFVNDRGSGQGGHVELRLERRKNRFKRKVE